LLTANSITYRAGTSGNRYSKKLACCGAVPLRTVVKLASWVSVVDTRIWKSRVLMLNGSPLLALGFSRMRSSG